MEIEDDSYTYREMVYRNASACSLLLFDHRDPFM